MSLPATHSGPDTPHKDRHPSVPRGPLTHAAPIMGHQDHAAIGTRGLDDGDDVGYQPSHQIGVGALWEAGAGGGLQLLESCAVVGLPWRIVMEEPWAGQRRTTRVDGDMDPTL